MPVVVRQSRATVFQLLSGRQRSPGIIRADNFGAQRSAIVERVDVGILVLGLDVLRDGREAIDVIASR
ncbi:hypothetical protein AB0G83_10625 [Streptomyces klenkii]|uniref:hypothetical protein n=1 Tax=Streptomyces klenkii TaxID=1420899 RepID=UPI0033CD9C7B